MQYNGQDNTLYYIRDASGNTIATYNYDGSNLSWVEQDLYGSNRLGLWNWKQALPSRTMVPQSETDTLSNWYMLGTRSYELNNHLENVLGVISDKKIGVSSGGSVVDYYKAEVLSENDYYPFGMEEPVREYNAGSYAYAFNGKRMEPLDPYITDLYDYGNRMYYGKVGRFFTVDPLTRKYPELTPYQFANNTPIQALDLDGLEDLRYVISFSSKTGKSQLKLAATTHNILGVDFFPSYYVSYKNKVYYLGDEISWLNKGVVSGMLNDLSGKTEVELDRHFGERKTVVEEVAETKRENAEFIQNLFTNAIIAAWAANTQKGTYTNSSGAKKVIEPAINESAPQDYLYKALKKQNYKEGDLIPSNFKQKFSENGYDYEIRIHPANPNYGKSGDIYRVARRKQGTNSNGQGFGWEYMDVNGTWHSTTTLKPQSQSYNNQAAEDTHIQKPNKIKR